MEERMEELERKLDRVVRLMGEPHRRRDRGRSPPARHHRVDTDGRWNGGSRKGEGSHKSHSPYSSEQRDSRSHDRDDRSSPHSQVDQPPHWEEHTPWNWRTRDRDRYRNDRYQSREQEREREREQKLDLPLFAGENVMGWLVKIERYFNVNNIFNDERITQVLMALDGKTLNWFQSWERHLEYPSWRRFKEAITRRFQPEVANDHRGPLFRLRQRGTVME